METAELRPLSLGELLDRTFTLYRNHFWVFVGIMAIPAAFGIPVNYLLLSAEGSMFGSALVPGSAPPTPPNPAFILGIFGGVFVFWIFLAIVYSIAVAAITHAVSEAYLGRNASVRGSYRSVRGKLWRLIGIDLNILIRMIGIFVGVVFLAGLAGAGVAATTAIGGNQAVVAGVMVVVVMLIYMGAFAAIVYLALRYAVTIPAFMLEDLGILASIRRSVQLTRGRRGHLFIAFLLATIIGYVGYIVFQGPFFIWTMISLIRNHAVASWLAMATAAAGAAGASLTGPILMIVIVLCYYDTRIRKEAFDLQFMMASLDRPAPAAGPVPSA